MIPERLVLATANRAKAAELGALVHDWGTVEVRDLDAFPGVACPPETGTTYVDNACLKARAVARATGLPALADDSGLEVDALGGAPGLHSARYAGEGAGDAACVQKLLGALASAPRAARGARFVCVVALVWPDDRVATAFGDVRGRIAAAPRGTAGFGYDPVFVPDGLPCTFAEASAAQKAALSHRARAVRALGAGLRSLHASRGPGKGFA